MMLRFPAGRSDCFSAGGETTETRDMTERAYVWSLTDSGALYIRDISYARCLPVGVRVHRLGGLWHYAWQMIRVFTQRAVEEQKKHVARRIRKYFALPASRTGRH